MENMSNKTQKLIKNHHFLDCGRIYKVCITAAAVYPGLLGPG
jgi:hypothetical protein